MTKLSDWELWACANQVLKLHGDKSAHHVAKQIGVLALQGDEDGISAWQEIARRIAAHAETEGRATRQ